MKAKIMENHVPTTPFGRRPISLGQIAAQMQIKRAVDDAGRPGSNHPAAINKWKLFRTLTEARSRLGVSDRTLGLLNALLSFHPETALSLPRRAEEGGPADGEADPSCDLVVFPSNKALALRAHGMTPTTLWRHLSALVEAGLLLRRDSPNGKRYARRAGEGEAERYSHAYGFDLTPLVVRAPEFEALAEAVRREARSRQLLKERISLLRRDAGKLLALGLDEALAGPWEDYRLRYMALMTPLRRVRDERSLLTLADDLAALRDAIVKTLDSQSDIKKSESNASRYAMHQSNSNTQCDKDSELASKEEGRTASAEAEDIALDPAGRQAESGSAYPLGLVMEACPDVQEYASSGFIRNWSQFLDAAAAVRPMLGISPDAWTEARAVLGDVQAHIVVATILQRSEYSSEAAAAAGSAELLVNGSPAIRSAGGYVRALTEQARAGAFQLGPVLMALIGQRLKAKRSRASSP